MEIYSPQEIKKIRLPASNSNGEDNGSITIIGGSDLFHGAPHLAMITASRFVDMVFFTSPEPSMGKIAEHLKSRLMSFIWMPFSEIKQYIKKSDAILIGPGLMRYRSEKDHPGEKKVNDRAGRETQKLTKELLTAFPDKKWVIDAGSLQVMEPEWIPSGAILTPNKKEYTLLFGNQDIKEAASKYNCTIVLKGKETQVVSPEKTIIVKGGNAGLTKGGTGDVQAGLTVALLAKNESLFAATTAAYLVKAAADNLFSKVGYYYNADDVANDVPHTLQLLLKTK